MKPETASILCVPETLEPLQLETIPGDNGDSHEELVSTKSKKIFLIQDGIPVFIDDSKITGFNKRYQGFYNRIANLYDGSIKLFGNFIDGGEEKFRREYLRELVIREDSLVLEVSIGTGGNLHYLPMSAKFFGLDISWGMLKRCQKNLNRWGLEAELILGNAEGLPFYNDTFDSVLHVGGINAFNDREKAISEMIRVAKSGTRIVIVDETAKIMNSIRWIPGVKKIMKQFGERFKAPVEFVPKNMRDIQLKDIAKGNMYCLSFTKP